jgi:HAD superfamily phosphoserine phosphatase-like hydrolase
MQELHEVHMRPHVSPAMRARVDEHRKAGDHLVVITASAFFFAEPLVRELGLDELLGTQVGFVDGRCTGLVDGEILEGPLKLAAAQKLAEARGVKLADCAFYSDHVADLPLSRRSGGRSPSARTRRSPPSPARAAGRGTPRVTTTRPD